MKLTIEANEAVNNGKKCWRVCIPLQLRDTYKRSSKFFKWGQAERARKFAEELNRGRRCFALQLQALPELVQGRLLVCLESAGGIDRLEQIIRGNAGTLARAGKPLDQAIAEHVAEREKAKLSPKHTKSIASCLGKLAALNQGATVADITPAKIGAWLEGHGWGGTSQNLHFRIAECFFRWAARLDYCPKSPLEVMMAPKKDEPEKGLLTPDQTAELLATCQSMDEALLPYFALVLFGGLRVCEVEKLTASNWRPGHIAVTHKVGKQNRARLIPINDTLGGWLAVSNTLSWENREQRVDAVCSALSFPWPANCMRHSFCTYSVALGSYGETAKMAGNSEAKLKSNYVDAMACKADAVAYFALTPSTVATRAPSCTERAA